MVLAMPEALMSSESNKRNSENKIPLKPIKKSTSESAMT